MVNTYCTTHHSDLYWYTLKTGTLPERNNSTWGSCMEDLTSETKGTLDKRVNVHQKQLYKPDQNHWQHPLEEVKGHWAGVSGRLEKDRGGHSHSYLLTPVHHLNSSEKRTFELRPCITHKQEVCVMSVCLGTPQLNETGSWIPSDVEKNPTMISFFRCVCYEWNHKPAYWNKSNYTVE